MNMDSAYSRSYDLVTIESESHGNISKSDFN